MLIEHIRTIEDKEKRTESAYVLVELMKLINPVARDSQESGQKLWDDLYIMSDFDLDMKIIENILFEKFSKELA